MSLSKLSEEFLKYIIEVKKPQGFIAIEENELPENLKALIFGLSDELEEAHLIKNIRKYGQTGNRGVDFFVLPRALTYFEEKVDPERNIPAISNTFTGPVSFGTGDAVSGEIVNKGNVSTEEKKTSFEKFWFKLILQIIAGIFVIAAAIIGISKCTPIPPTPTPTDYPTIPPTATNTPTITSIPSIIPTLAPTPNICHYSNGPYTVGIINPGPDWKYGDIVQRLEKFGFDITLLDPSANYEEFSKFDVIYLPSGWGTIYPTLELYPWYLLKYVEKGGGLLVEQPDNKNKFTPGFLPFAVSFDTSKINPSDWPLVIVDNSYSITRGLDADDLPGPMDCATFDNAYGALVKGGVTGCTSLAITSYGSGRILVSLGNISPSMTINNLHMISDTAICRMFGWVSKEYSN